MIQIQQGDIIAYNIRDNKFGIAHVLICEKLISTQYHLALLDMVFESEFEFDFEGNLVLLNQPYNDFSNLKIAVDHLAISEEALQASKIASLGNIEVEDNELDGYRVWLTLKREEAMQQGMYSAEEDDDDDDEDEDEENEDNEKDDDELENSNDKGIATKTIIVKPWHGSRVCDVPIGQRLFEWNMHYDDGLESTNLCGYVLSKANNLDEINEIVDRFVQGDYSAGHELLEYGNTAGMVLGKQLTESTTPELAADILQVLGDMGTDSSYEYIVNFFVNNYEKNNDLAAAAIRGYAYAVMVTAGDNKVIAEHLDKLFSVSNSECEYDIQSAKEAVENYQKNKSKDEAKVETSSSNPFGMLDV